MTEEEEKVITREKHPGRVTQGHKLAALMKKRKEEILRSKEQSPVQPTEQSSVQSTVQSTVQSSAQSNDTYVYGVGLLAVLAIDVCVFFLHITLSLKIKNKTMIAWWLRMSKENKINQKDVICFRKNIYNKMSNSDC